MQNAVTAMPVVIPICSVALVACLVMLGCSDVSSQRSRQTAEPPNLDESRLPDLPNPVGLAGPFAGASNGALIVAGGTNFPGKMPWEGGVKTWHDDAYVLDSTDGPWKSGYKLPRPLAYGVSLSSKYGVLCIGGNDSERVVSDVSLLQWKNGEVSIRRLPDLPAPMAGACGAILGDTAYVAGGYTAVDSIAEESQHNFWSLDLSRPDASWRVLEPWPGPGRFFAVAGATDDSVYIFSGMRRQLDASQKPQIGFLRDGYRYTPTRDGGGGKWTRIADLPRAHAAAPGPAAYLENRWLAIVGGGVDDTDIAHPMQERTEFRKSVIAYDTLNNRWQTVGAISQARVATPLVPWGRAFVVSSGEVRSGVRSPEEWAYTW
jgi:N-acetylneuraminic acid mutarotase